MSKRSAPKDATPTQQSNPTKLESFLTALLAVGFQGLRSLECSDRPGIPFHFNGSPSRFWSSCLHSDVSSAKKNLGINIGRRIDPYESPEGHTASFKRYWLASYKDALEALKEVNRLRVKRNQKPITPEKYKLILSAFF